MLELNYTDTYKLSDNIFLQKISELEKYWVFNIDNGEHYSLNETSYWILEKIAAGFLINNIMADFLQEFDVDEAHGKNDFNEILNNFIKEDIITRRKTDEKEKDI